MKKLPNQIASEKRQCFAPHQEGQRTLDDIEPEAKPRSAKDAKPHLKQQTLFDDTVVDDWGDSRDLRLGQKRLL